MKCIKVVCGIIWKNEKVLIARRKPEKSLGGYWEFPGGKIENDEIAENALIRELNEELSLTIGNIRHYDTHIHRYDSFSIELIAYQCDFVNASFELTDHDQFEFVNPNRLKDYKIAPADVYFVEKLCL